MANPVRVNVTGLADLERRLSALGKDMGGKIARGAAAAGVNVIKAEARRRVPVKTGAAKQAIVTKRVRGTPLAAEYVVGFKKAKKADRNGPKDGWYARLLEFGTVKMPAQPFMRPAFDTQKQAAVDKVAQVLKKRLDKVGA